MKKIMKIIIFQILKVKKSAAEKFLLSLENLIQIKTLIKVTLIYINLSVILVQLIIIVIIRIVKKLKIQFLMKLKI